MKIRPLAVPGSFLLEPRLLGDHRGHFYESFKDSAFTAAVGRTFHVAQTNFSVSRRGVVRGLHATHVPPGQAKIVTCHRGALQDIVVDVRWGSPTFGQYQVTVLEAGRGTAVYIAEGLAHGFAALTDDTCIGYLCSSEYAPGHQLDLNPFDPDLALPWDVPDGTPLVSEKDREAPGLREAQAAGLLPPYADCLRLHGQESDRQEEVRP
ncbi:dTDP-4-dehydrorhamnose 3,5-epimerase family protein [Streptomyces sp. NPDC048483]|uniref:dTDP-4-dehydrorhamnose 3,5-epimerase family protein n=1 Tax=Streptomyces sp. NPDC048483 TaxID=3154927 RepID=UPI0034496B8A